MAKIHDKFVIELAEVIKGYGNDPDVDDPFCLSEFYRFYELPNIAVSRENFEKMQSVEPERKTGRWIRNDNGTYSCSVCQTWIPEEQHYYARYCLYCGSIMNGDKRYEED